MSDDQQYEKLTRLDRFAAAVRSAFGSVGRGFGAVHRGTRGSGRAVGRAAAAGNPFLLRIARWLGPAWRLVRPVFVAVSPLGYGVLVLSLIAWLAGWLLGWAELLVVAAAGLITLVLSALLTVGRPRLRVRIDVQPSRVVAGDPANVRLSATNASRARLLPVLLEMPVGVTNAQFPLRRLRMSEVQDEDFSLATNRRGIVTIGPATSRRGDPFGLVRRTMTWTDAVEVVVHPQTVDIEPLGGGLLRDLEGHTTPETSTTDLAFHALREYAPGDDRRYIHWRSSARASELIGAGNLLVRQFLDTRRSYLTVVVDGRAEDYLDDLDFDIAVSAAASVVRRAFADGVDTSLLVADRTMFDDTLSSALDAFARARLGTDVPLQTMAAQAARVALDTTVAVLVTGARAPFDQLQRAAMHFGPEVSVVAVRVDPAGPASLTASGRLVVVNLPELSGLRSLLDGVSRI